MPLAVSRQDGETWRQAVERIASKHGLKQECLEYFDRDRATGTPDDVAAWNALYEWDCTEYVEEEK